MTDLKPCPHCGGQVRYNHDIDLIPNGIFCPNCHMFVRFTTIHANKKDRLEVIMEQLAEAWNKRT